MILSSRVPAKPSFATSHMKLHDSANILRFGAPLTEARGAIILIHGRGSSADDISRLAETLPSEGLAFLAPSATGGVWYPQRFLAALELNEPALSVALNTIDELVSEITRARIPGTQIGLVGFSQGACLALEYAVRHPLRYAFVASLSGALIGPLTTPRASADLQGTPVLLGCAERDAHIPLPFVEQSADTLTRFGASVTKQIYPGSAHTVFPEEIDWLSRKPGADNPYWTRSAGPFRLSDLPRTLSVRGPRG